MAAYFEVSVCIYDTEHRDRQLEIRRIRTKALRLRELDNLVALDLEENVTAEECAAEFFSLPPTKAETK